MALAVGILSQSKAMALTANGSQRRQHCRTLVMHQESTALSTSNAESLQTTLSLSLSLSDKHTSHNQVRVRRLNAFIWAIDSDTLALLCSLAM